MAAEVLNQNLRRPDLADRFAELKLTMHVLASRQKFTIVFDKGEVEVKEGHIGKARVTVRAPFSALLKLTLRKVPAGNILLFKVYVFGNYFKFWKAAKLLQRRDSIPPELLEGG